MKTTKKYWILEACGEDDSAVIAYFPDEYPEDRFLLDSKSMKNEFPSYVRLNFSPSYPDMVKLYDFVESIFGFPIVSAKVKQVLDDLKIDDVEYIPAKLYDHRGKLAGDNYYIIYTLNKQPLVDMKLSKYEMSALDETQIFGFDELHLDVDAIDSAAMMFRATNENSICFIADIVLKALEKAKVSGLRVIEADGWNGRTLSLI